MILIQQRDIKNILLIFTAILTHWTIINIGINGETINKRKKILSFGGNGFIGSQVISTLLKIDEYDITLVSRGNWHFDTQTSIYPFVKFIPCDREIGIKSCEMLLEDVFNTEEYYAILDFSGFEKKEVRDVVDVIGRNSSKARVYIYISSDNIYEVCQRFPKNEGKNGSVHLLTEADAVRPRSEAERVFLNSYDEYGDNKLQCEEYLMNQRESGGIPYVTLRLADVIGPRDNSDRFSLYYAWLKYHHIEGVPHISVPHDVLETTSVTYVYDIVQSVISAMATPSSWDQAYNIACKETFNVTNVIESIATMMNKSNIEVMRAPDDDVDSFYPGVTRGPLDITNAIDKLEFKPTPLDIALETTFKWFDSAMEDETFRYNTIREWLDEIIVTDSSSDDDDDDDGDSIISNILNDILGDKDEL